jgi:hypothetical protein
MLAFTLLKSQFTAFFDREFVVNNFLFFTLVALCETSLNRLSAPRTQK